MGQGDLPGTERRPTPQQSRPGHRVVGRPEGAPRDQSRPVRRLQGAVDAGHLEGGGEIQVGLQVRQKRVLDLRYQGGLDSSRIAEARIW